MKPIEFKEQTTIFAKDQPEYQPLPAWRSEDMNDEVISCWKFTFAERMMVLFGGKIWLRQYTFGHKLQPLLPQTENPFIEQKGG